MEEKIAVVTGANRGLGKGTAEALAKLGYQVVVTCRKVSEGEPVAKQIGGVFHPLDVTDPNSIERLVEFLNKKGRLDVLINNAGILPDRDAPALRASIESCRKAFETNTLGALLLSQKCIPLMKKTGGRIVNVSSGMGQLKDMSSGYIAYRMSKAALNVVTRVLANETRGSGILINSVCPGWVKTDMGGAGASRELSEGVASILWAATLPDSGPTGGFFRDGKPLEW